MFNQHLIEIIPLFIVSLSIIFVQCNSISNINGNNLNPTEFFGTAVELQQNSMNHHHSHVNNPINYRLKKNLKLPNENKQQNKSTTSVDVVDDLLKIDRNNLSTKQKVLLEKIVERVARLRGSFINNDTTTNTEDQSLNNDNDNDEQQKKTTEDIIGRSNTNAFSLLPLITTTKYPTTNMNMNYNGNNNQQQLEQQLNNTNEPIETVITDLPDVITSAVDDDAAVVASDAIEKHRNYNKIDLNNSDSSSAILSSIIGNYTDLLLGNISTLSIVDSLSAENIPQHDIYEGRHPAIAPTLSDKVSFAMSIYDFYNFKCYLR